MTSKLTRERIEWLNYAATGLAANGTEMAMSPQDVIALTEYCLAAMDSEPVATLDVQSRRPDGNKFALVFSSAAHKLPDDVYFLYRHAQQPVVPDERAAFNAWNNEDNLPIAGVGAKNAAWLAWQARSELAGNSPVIPEWIPVSERMPESNGLYFGWDGKRVLEVNCFFGGFSANQFIHGEITHWMPLPAAPQELK